MIEKIKINFSFQPIIIIELKKLLTQSDIYYLLVVD